ncbi:MAG TPA: glycoside hydrolase TIM-barrel-like domain-containing protein [Rhizomicrobium sp.]|nr:glycoside hydrolase TIM-barrel-like domain-containing protein [Rhizomicrobium sp.]
MAGLVLGAVGSALGASLIGDVAFLGLTIAGSQIGGAIGALVGSEIDSLLMPGQSVKRTGPRLTDTSIQSSTEGAPVPRLYGRVRVAGQLLWATKFKETVTTTKTHDGGKGAGGATVTDTEYSYSISFAVGLCAGSSPVHGGGGPPSGGGGGVAKIGRVWADGNPIDITQFTTRFYPGDETQDFDPLIVETEGEANTPAYRGLAYIVFEDMPLAQFGNRIPQLQFEVIRALSDADPDALENLLPAVALIPGAGEFVYATEVVTADDGNGTTVPQNAHNSASETDMKASLDELQALAPNLGAVSLVVGWFGNDLRCDQCLIKPGVEIAQKNTYPEAWSVDGIARGDAYVVSQVNGIPAYGGTPSDESVAAAIADLKARGLAVMLCPFLFMDIAAGNALTDPYTGASGQGAYPWRGRITCDPAPGVSGSPDKTSAAGDQVDAFFNGDWGYRRMVLHYAQLCADAGGVDAFLIGSELRGLTRVRSSATDYPSVAALKTLAADVRAILGPDTKIGYAADWSEYNNHQTGDAPGAVLFNLDPLWSDTNIDFVGIDNYMPLADWRDGTAGLDYDAANGPTSIHDLDYLTRNITGGEDFDWYYASPADRDTQTRTPITDGLGKPWVWRAKDVKNWWSNAHYDRAGGSESGSPTAWTPQSKPIWFCELGCPAIDKGANEPNVFFDPKSSESAVPYYSNGERDDLIQRLFLQAHFEYWNDAANNPVSTVYGAPMVAASRIFAWCWDARPFPFFPARADVWGDAADYQYGHWLNGRLGAVQLADLVASLCEDAGFTDYDVSDLSGLVTGFAVTDTMSPRDAIAPLATAYCFDAVESEGVIRFVMRGQPNPASYGEGDVVMPDGDPGFGFSFERAQETDLPLASRIAYIDADADYRQAVVEARRLAGSSDHIVSATLSLVLDQGQAIGIGQRLLMDAWTMRESATFALPPSALALDPTDEVLLDAGGRTRRLRLTEIDDAGARKMQAVSTDPSIYDDIVGPSRAPASSADFGFPGRALVVFLDLPLLTGTEIPWAPTAAAFANPWPGAELVLKSASDSNYALDTTLAIPAVIGETTSDFNTGPLWCWDEGNTLEIKLYNGACASRDDLSVLGGANVLCVQNADGDWEVLQYASATLVAPGRWRLTKLLRGQAGTEGAIRDPVASGARVVLIDGAQKQLALTQDQYALPFNYLWGPQGKPISDPAYQGAALQFKGVGLRPLSPVQLSAVWQSGDLVLNWIRRTRIGGDSWDQTEVPLGEDFEKYDLEILDASGDVIRTETITSPSFTYTATAIATDFPSGLPSPFRFRVYQLSATYGRGEVAAAEIAFT